MWVVAVRGGAMERCFVWSLRMPARISRDARAWRWLSIHWWKLVDGWAFDKVGVVGVLFRVRGGGAPIGVGLGVGVIRRLVVCSDLLGSGGAVRRSGTGMVRELTPVWVMLGCVGGVLLAPLIEGVADVSRSNTRAVRLSTLLPRGGAVLGPVGCGRLHGGGRTLWALAGGRLGVSGLPGSMQASRSLPMGVGEEDLALRPVLGPTRGLAVVFVEVAGGSVVLVGVVGVGWMPWCGVVEGGASKDCDRAASRVARTTSANDLPVSMAVVGRVVGGGQLVVRCLGVNAGAVGLRRQ